MTLRVNPRFGTAADYRAQLEAAEMAAQPVAGLPQALLLAGQLQVELGEDEAARATFEDAVEQAPGGSALEAVALARLAESALIPRERL